MVILMSYKNIKYMYNYFLKKKVVILAKSNFFVPTHFFGGEMRVVLNYENC